MPSAQKHPALSPRFRDVVHYIGHAFHYGTGAVDDAIWWLGNEECCFDHTAMVDVKLALEELLQDPEVQNDIMLIFHCPFNIYRHFKVDVDVSSSRPKRSIQLMCFPEEFTKPLSCNKMLQKVDECQVEMMLVRPQLSMLPTLNLAVQLGNYFGKTASVVTLLDSMAHTASNRRVGPYHRQILGQPEDFVLSQMTQIKAAFPVGEVAKPEAKKTGVLQELPPEPISDSLDEQSELQTGDQSSSGDAQSIKTHLTLHDVERSDRESIALSELEREDGVKE